MLGKVTMLSQGIQNIDNIFTILNGSSISPPPFTPRGNIPANTLTGELTMYVDKETYERAGLVGKPHGGKGNREGKPRWSKPPPRPPSPPAPIKHLTPAPKSSATTSKPP